MPGFFIVHISGPVVQRLRRLVDIQESDGSIPSGINVGFSGSAIREGGRTIGSGVVTEVLS